MDVSFHHNEQLVRPWRLAAFTAAAIAAVELIVLVVVGGAMIAKASTGSSAKPAHKAAVTQTESAKSIAAAPATKVPAAGLKRSRVSVLVLNGGTHQGAAAATAARVAKRGYRIGGVANAPSSDFTRTLVMYRPGFAGEGRRLAHDLGIGIVGPLDGLRTSQLHGSHAVVVIGG